MAGAAPRAAVSARPTCPQPPSRRWTFCTSRASHRCFLNMPPRRASWPATSLEPPGPLSASTRTSACGWRRYPPGVPASRPFFRVADVVLAGADEAVALTQATSWRAAAEQLHQICGAVVVVKDGARGASAFDGTSWHSAPAVEVRAVDPVGAGDAFNAGFLAFWLQSRDLQQALANGARSGAMSVGARGDTTGIPDTPLGPSSGSGDVSR